MKKTKKQLLLIVILVISAMAIIITASQIYKINNNDKVIDNNINGISVDEGTYDENTINIFNEYNPKAAYNWDPFPGAYPPSFPLEYYSDWVIQNETRRRVYIKVQYGIVSKSIEINNLKDNTITTNYNYDLQIFSQDTENKLNYNDQSSSPNIIKNVDEFTSTIFQNIPTSDGLLVDYIINQYKITGIIYNYNINKNILNFSFYFINYISVNSQKQELIDNQWSNSTIEEIAEAGITSNKISMSAKTYGIEFNSINLGNTPFSQIESIELLQIDTKINNKKISQYIYEEIIKNWGKGKETAEIKCSIGEYYDEEKNLVISTEKNDVPMLFSIGDEVIPYIAGANNTEIPLSKSKYGTPKKFIVTKVRPNFDGACWQYLTLQEVSVDSIVVDVTVQSGTDGNSIGGYPCIEKPIYFNLGEIISATITYYEFADVNFVSPKTVIIDTENNTYTVKLNTIAANQETTVSVKIYFRPF